MALALLALALLPRPAVAKDVVIEFTHGPREACGDACRDSFCVAWTDTTRTVCTQRAPCGAETRLAQSRLWGFRRWGLTWTLLRSRPVATTMAGQPDTMAVPAGWTSEVTVAITDLDQAGNESCRDLAMLPLYNDSLDARTAVEDLPPPGAVIERYDLSGARRREPGDQLPTGIYFERIRYRGTVRERKVVVIH